MCVVAGLLWEEAALLLFRDNALEFDKNKILPKVLDPQQDQDEESAVVVMEEAEKKRKKFPIQNMVSPIIVKDSCHTVKSQQSNIKIGRN